VSLDEIATHAAMVWIALALILGIAELVIPGVFLIFLAIAAAATGVAIFALPGLPLILQLASFAAWSGVTVAIGRRWYADYPVNTTDPLLNERIERLIGATVTVEQAIEHGAGRVSLGDSSWVAHGADATPGTQLRIAAVEGSALVVEPLPPPEI
jgi:membrane protein implicated in regulation of membrane protease activity